MERLAARGWHNAVSPPLGLREVADTQIPGAHAPGFTIPPHFGGYETNASVNGTGMIYLAVQAQLFTGPASPSRTRARDSPNHFAKSYSRQQERLDREPRAEPQRQPRAWGAGTPHLIEDEENRRR